MTLCFLSSIRETSCYIQTSCRLILEVHSRPLILWDRILKHSMRSPNMEEAWLLFSRLQNFSPSWLPSSHRWPSATIMRTWTPTFSTSRHKPKCLSNSHWIREVSSQCKLPSLCDLRPCRPSQLVRVRMPLNLSLILLRTRSLAAPRYHPWWFSSLNP